MSDFSHERLLLDPLLTVSNSDRPLVAHELGLSGLDLDEFEIIEMRKDPSPHFCLIDTQTWTQYHIYGHGDLLKPFTVRVFNERFESKDDEWMFMRALLNFLYRYGGRSELYYKDINGKYRCITNRYIVEN